MQTAEQKRAWYVKNRDRIAARQSEWRKANREKRAAQDARHYERNRERLKEEARERYHRDRDANLSRQAAYRRANREYFKVAAAARRGRIAEGDLTLEQWLSILEEFDHRCAYCQVQGALEIEHMTPLSRGGLHTADNAVPACRSCSSRKHTKTIFEFLST